MTAPKSNVRPAMSRDEKTAATFSDVSFFNCLSSLAPSDAIVASNSDPRTETRLMSQRFTATA